MESGFQLKNVLRLSGDEENWEDKCCYFFLFLIIFDLTLVEHDYVEKMKRKTEFLLITKNSAITNNYTKARIDYIQVLIM